MDETERTEFVTAGSFALVSNPIFSAMVPAFLGLVHLVPTIAAILGFAALVVRIIKDEELPAYWRKSSKLVAGD